MQLKTILNRLCTHKSFVYTDVKMIQEKDHLLLTMRIEPRRNSRPVCSGCGQSGPGYDTLPSRRFEFIPFWGM